jgi:FtsZ-binding cell division protein ZapB
MTSTPFNINITGSGENLGNLSNEPSEFKDYIIKNNINLTNENKELRIKISELEKEICDHETENDKYDERIRYMRGLMQNLYSLKEMNKETTEMCLKYYNKQSELFKKYSDIEYILNKNFKFYIYLVSFPFIYYAVIYKSYKIIFIFMMQYFTYGYFLYLFNKFYNDNKLFSLEYSYSQLFIFKLFDYNKYKNEHIKLLTIIKEKEKEIKEFENNCAGVSVMIDNI